MEYQVTLHIFIQHFLCTFKDTYKVYENGGYNEEITHLPVSHNFSVIIYIALNKKQQHQHFVKTLCIFNEAAKVTYFSYKFSIVTKTIL